MVGYIPMDEPACADVEDDEDVEEPEAGGHGDEEVNICGAHRAILFGVERESIPPFQVRVCYNNRMVGIARDVLP